MSKFTLDDLAAIIAARAGAKAESSYTKSLLDGGTPRAAKKMGEEAIEVIIAALEDEPRGAGQRKRRSSLSSAGASAVARHRAR